jgi:hypothetical protein
VSRIRFHGSPIGPDISAAPAARLTGETRLQIGQADIIGPLIATDCRVVAAAIIGAIDQETANASGAHFREGDLLAVAWRLATGEGGHAVIKSARLPNGKFDSKISFSK